MDPAWLLERFGSQFFWVSTAIVFVECGLLFPILPGDSLLFAIGLFIANKTLHFNIVTACLILSDRRPSWAMSSATRSGGPSARRSMASGPLHQQGQLRQDPRFFERYGAKALVLGRFVPIVRTFITVVAGVGKMERRHFFVWSGVGAVLWAVGVTLAGYFLGSDLPGLKDHLESRDPADRGRLGASRWCWSS
jgi:membrane-associated protein